MQAPTTTPMIKQPKSIEEKAVLNTTNSNKIPKLTKKQFKKRKPTLIFSMNKIEKSAPKIEHNPKQKIQEEHERPKSTNYNSNNLNQPRENTLKLSRVSTYFNPKTELMLESAEQTANRRKIQWNSAKLFMKKRKLVEKLEKPKKLNSATKHEILIEKVKEKQLVGSKISEMNKRLGFYDKMMMKKKKEVEFMKKMIEKRKEINDEKEKWKSNYEKSKIQDQKRVDKFKSIFKDMNKASKIRRENNLNQLLARKRSYAMQKKSSYKKLIRAKSQENKKNLKKNKKIVKKIQKMKEEAKQSKKKFQESISQNIAKRIEMKTKDEERDIKNKERVIKSCIQKQKNMVQNLHVTTQEHDEVKKQLQILLKYRLESPKKSALVSNEKVIDFYLKSIDAVGKGVMDIVGKNKKKKNKLEKMGKKKRNSFLVKKRKKRGRTNSRKYINIKKKMGLIEEKCASLNRFSKIFSASSKVESERGSVKTMKNVSYYTYN